MAVRKVLADGAREFNLSTVSMDSTSVYCYLYYVFSGNALSMNSGMATSSGQGHFFCRLHVDSFVDANSSTFAYAKWSVPFGTDAAGAVATYEFTNKFQIVLEGEFE
jgi:hypothetical protein